MSESQDFIIEFSKWMDPIKVHYNKFKKRENTTNLEDLEQYEGPAFQTSDGHFIPINESNLPSTVYNFWRGDTNFWLTGAIKSVIVTTRGVETFDIQTPYRFRISVGKLFDESDVKKRVKDRVLEYLKNKYQPNNTHKYETLHKQYKFFAVVGTDNKLVFSGNSKEEVQAQINKHIIQNPKDEIYLSWDK